MSSPISPLNTRAQALKALHMPGKPLILTNVHDAHSAKLVAMERSCRAMATASWSIAAVQGFEDDDMSLADNLVGIRNVVRGIANAAKTDTVPLSADIQSGYDDVAGVVGRLVELGVVGCNIEDLEEGGKGLRGVDDAVERVRCVVETARGLGLPDFVVNARTDVLGYGGSLEDVVDRGRKFLEVGATAVFVWGCGKWDLKVDEVKWLCEQLGGMVSVHGPGPTGMSLKGLKEAGVCRISFGPWFFRKGMETFVSRAKDVLEEE